MAWNHCFSLNSELQSAHFTPPCISILLFLCFMTRNPNFGAIWLGKKCAQKHRFNKAFGFLSTLRYNYNPTPGLDPSLKIGRKNSTQKTLKGFSNGCVSTWKRIQTNSTFLIALSMEKLKMRQRSAHGTLPYIFIAIVNFIVGLLFGIHATRSLWNPPWERLNLYKWIVFRIAVKKSAF